MTQPPKKRKAPKKATPKYLENAALYYLGRFATSSENFRKVLMRKVERSARFHGTDRAEGAKHVDALVRRFTANGLLDDRTYAEAQVISLHRSGRGERAIRARLRQKGVAGDIIGQALAKLAGLCQEPDLMAAIRHARRRRFGPYRAPQKRRERREKDLAAMARAGFAYDMARRVIDAKTAEELEEEVDELSI